MTPDDDYELEAQIGFLLRRAQQRHVAIFAESMGDIDLTPTQFSALVKIRDEGGVSQNRLGRLDLAASNFSAGTLSLFTGRGLDAAR